MDKKKRTCDKSEFFLPIAGNYVNLKHSHGKDQPVWYYKQPTWRLWGEEKSDGAIYSVYLKKVRYHQPVKFAVTSSSESDDEISHLEWETVRIRFVKAGTLKTLVAALATDDGELESTYVNVFLATFRTFSTPKEVLKLLLERFEELSTAKIADVQHRKTLVSVLHVWLDSYPEDFRIADDLRHLLTFCEQFLPHTELHTKLERRLQHLNCQNDTSPSVILVTRSLPSTTSLALRSSTTHSCPFKLPDVPVRHFAEQLTRMDVELFKKLIPHQCLGAIWSRRDKSRSLEAATVLATVNQFNALSFRVISTILMDVTLKTSERSAIITCWIDIAQELRLIKNFSGLKAIISGLQSNPVYRLQRTWQTVSRDKTELFYELAHIFSEDNNQSVQRALLMREGTAKYANTVSEHDRHLPKIIQKRNCQNHSIAFGTIPYLGTFLTDLTMIDTAIPDTINGLINFDKRRKEFEVLAQIKLLQGAANAYNFTLDTNFDRWFDTILVLDDRDAYQLSCQIEAPSLILNNNNLSNSYCKNHRKNDSITSTSSSNGSTSNDLDQSVRSESPPLRLLGDHSNHSSTNSSFRSLNSSNSGGALTPSPKTTPTPNFYVIKVTLDSDTSETDGVVLYKSIMLSNNERTPQVIRNAMYKLGLEGSTDDYTLAQVLPDKEMVLPQNANVYYALNAAHNLNFILRHTKPKPKQ